MAKARTRGEDGHLLAPGSYLVYLNPDDFTRLVNRSWTRFTTGQ